jgi:hypothetical protein
MSKDLYFTLRKILRFAQDDREASQHDNCVGFSCYICHPQALPCLLQATNYELPTVICNLSKRTMLSPYYYLILQFLAQIVEIVTVPRHPYNKPAVFPGVLLGIPQRIGANHVKLYMMPSSPSSTWGENFWLSSVPPVFM